MRVSVSELVVSHEPGFACGKSRLVDDGLLHLRPFNIGTDGRIDLRQSYLIPPEEAPAGKSELLPGDILFNNTNSVELVGKSSLVVHRMCAGFSNHLTRVRVNQDRVLPAYFSYWLRKLQAQGHFSHAATQWVSQAAYKTSELVRLKLNLPRIDDQARSVDLLTRAEGIVRLRREAAAKAAELIPAMFVDLFGEPAANPRGWPVLTLGELLLNGPNNGLYKHKSAYGRGTPILRIDAFYDGVVGDLATLKRVELDAGELQRFVLTAGDIVINRVNSPEYLGKSAIIPTLTEPTVFESNMMRFAVDPGRVLPRYLIALLQTSAARQHFLAHAKHAINQSSINQQDVKSLPVPVPPLDRQQAFAHRAEAAESILQQQATALAKAQATFDALLAQAFAPAAG